MLHVRVVSPQDLTARLVAALSAELGVRNLVVLLGAARSPDGDVTIRNVRSLRPSDLGEVVAVDWREAETIVAVSRRMDGPVSQVSVDGLTRDLLPGSNLTPPLRAVAAAPNPLMNALLRQPRSLRRSQ